MRALCSTEKLNKQWVFTVTAPDLEAELRPESRKEMKVAYR